MVNGCDFSLLIKQYNDKLVTIQKIQIWLNPFGTIVPIPAICYRHRVERTF